MSPVSFGKFRASLMKALRNIGKTNGTGAPQSGNNVDSLLHELMVANTGASYFEDRKKHAKMAVLEAIDTVEFENHIREVIDTNTGVSVQVYDGEVYSLVCDIKRPALRVNDTKLRNALIRKGMSSRDVDALFNKSSDYANQPSHSRS